MLPQHWKVLAAVGLLMTGCTSDTRPAAPISRADTLVAPATPPPSVQPATQPVSESTRDFAAKIAQSQKAAQVFVRAHKLCVEDYATKMASAQEPAETIVTAAQAYCASIESDYQRYLLTQIRDPDMVRNVIAQLRQTSREYLTMFILDLRNAPRPAPRTPSSLQRI
jgi:hypothetical protein